MAIIDLSNYSLGELKGLQFEIEKEIKNRQRKDVKKAREQIISIAQTLGISVEDLLANTKAKSKGGSGAKMAPRYRNPADSSQTWTGRGRQPRWLVAALASGKTLEDLKV